MFLTNVPYALFGFCLKGFLMVKINMVKLQTRHLMDLDVPLGIGFI